MLATLSAMKKSKRGLCRRASVLSWVCASIVLFSGLSSLFQWVTHTTNETKMQTEGGIGDGQIKVLLFSYYRSGSSFLGSLFDMNPSVFYWFEPLAPVTLKWGWVHGRTGLPPRNLYHYDNGTEKSIPVDDLRETLLSPLHSIYGCNFSSLPDSMFTNQLSSITWSSKMSSMDRYRLCTMRFRKPRELNLRFRECVPRLRRQCRVSEIIAVKTIRLRMKLIEDLFEADRSIRLVYMIRDPRGMLNSWWTHTRLSRQNYGDHDRQTDARVTCLRMLSDWRTFLALSRKYPNNCLWLRYEDLARSPEAETDRVYRFLGLPIVPRAVVAGLRSITAANSSNGHFGVQRANSSITASQWISSMTPQLQRMVAENCRQLIHELGFQS